jgi:hypothetical protein
VVSDRDPAAITQRLAEELAGVLEQPEVVQRIAAVIRAAASEPDVANLMREFFPGAVLPAVRGLLGPGDPRLRLNLFGSQIIGLVMARAVVGLEPLASIPARDLAVAVAPNLAHYLIGPLDEAAAVGTDATRSPAGA